MLKIVFQQGYKHRFKKNETIVAEKMLKRLGFQEIINIFFRKNNYIQKMNDITNLVKILEKNNRIIQQL